jgi:hypothetical protein
MIYLIAYYVIGLIVSSYFIYYYRFSPKTSRQQPKKSDSIGGMIGPLVWPLQIILHFFTRNNYKQK